MLETKTENPSTYVIHKRGGGLFGKGERLGSIQFLKPQSGSHVCTGYFLEKLTPLPRTLTTQTYEHNGKEIIRVPEEVPDGDVLIEGKPEVLRIFSGAKSL